MNATSGQRSTLLVSAFLLSVSALGASPQSLQLERTLGELMGYYAFPASARRQRMREEFCELARRWRKDTQWLSSPTQIAMHPAYQAIIGMGAPALGWILEDLQADRAQWFWALKAIAREDPIPPQDRGDIARMTDRWLDWGRDKGIITP